MHLASRNDLDDVKRPLMARVVGEVPLQALEDELEQWRCDWHSVSSLTLAF